MRLLVTFNSSEQVLSIDVSNEMCLADLKAYIDTESGALSRTLMYDGEVMQGDARELKEWELKDDDMIAVVVDEQPTQTQTQIQSGPAGTSGGDLERFYGDIERVRQQLLRDEVLRRGVEQKYPQLVSVLNDPEMFRNTMIQVEKARVEEEDQRRKELKRLQDDPYNEESQRRILEMIQQEAIIDNLNTALEYSPEVFGTVTMLFVDVLVNGQRVKAFVDSGAQTTVISPARVEQCNMTHLVDKRFQGVAHGVGTAKILGRIHSAPMKVGNSFLPCSFTVMEGSGVDLLLGLDMLKRHQGCIDLRRNVLVLGDSEVPFLAESEIPNQFLRPVENSVTTTSSETPGPGSSGPLFQGAATSSSGTTGSVRSRMADAQPHPRTTSTSSYSEETIENLINLGFSREEVLRVLDQAGGNPELAAALLFQ